MKYKEKRQRLSFRLVHQLLMLYIWLGGGIALMIVFIVLYFVTHRSYFLYFLVAAGLVVELFAMAWNLLLPHFVAKQIRSGLTDDLTRTINNLPYAREEVKMKPSGIIEFDELKERFAALINSHKDSVVIDRAVDESMLSLSYEKGFDKLLTKESFDANLPLILNLNSYARGGLLLAQACGKAKPDKDVMTALLSAIRKTFSTRLYIGLYASDTLICYVSDIESLSTFSYLCSRLYASFSVLKTVEASNVVFSCRVGAAVYPYSFRQSLIDDAERALAGTQKYDVYIPREITFRTGFMLSRDEIRKKDLVILERLIGDIYSLGNSAADKEKAEKDVLSFASMSGFETIGNVSFASSDTSSGMLTASQEQGNKAVSLFDKGTEVSLSVLEPIYKARDENNCFYSTRREDLSPQLAAIFDRHRLQAVYCYFYGHEGHLLGMTYLISSKRLQPLSSVDSHLLAMEMLAAGFFSQSQLIEQNRKLSESDIDAVLKLDGKMRYVINAKTYSLRLASDSLIASYGQKIIGQKCYKVFYDLEAPCADCPFVTGREIGVKTSLAGGVFFRRRLSLDAASQLGSVLLEPYDEKTLDRYQSYYDPLTLLNSRVSFNSALRNLIGIKAKGMLLLISVEGTEGLLSSLGEENLNRLLIDIRERIEQAGIDQKIYRFDSEILSMFFNDLGKVDSYDIVEKIHQAVSKTYVLEGNQVKVRFRYTEIEFKGDFVSDADVFFAIEKGLSKTMKLPSDYLCIPAEDIVRLASRSEYIIYLMEANFLNKSVEFRIQPDIDLKDGTLRYGEILLRLYDVLRDRMLNPFEVVTIAAAAKRMGKFDSLNYETAASLYAKYGGSVFRVYDFRGFSINLSTDSLDSDDWLESLKKYIEANSFPTGFLGFEIDETDFETQADRIRLWLNELRPYNLSWAIDNYVDEKLSPREAAEFGFQALKLSKRLIGDAVSDPIARGLLESIIREAHFNDLKVIVQGVETQEQYELALEAQADYAQGFFLYKPLKIDEFVTAVGEHFGTRQKELLRLSAALKASENDKEGKPSEPAEAAKRRFRLFGRRKGSRKDAAGEGTKAS